MGLRRWLAGRNPDRRPSPPGTGVLVATWNMKHVAPRASLDERWDWFTAEVADPSIPTIGVLTEAAVPRPVASGETDWQALGRAGGLGPNRRWGTVLVARGAHLTELTHVPTRRGDVPLTTSWPGAVTVADVVVEGERWATLVGLYGVTQREPGGESCGHGGYSVPLLMQELRPLLQSSLGDRVVVAGDLNLGPDAAAVRGIESLGLVELIGWTSDDRRPLERCPYDHADGACGHLWTHWNGRSPNAKRQQIDFIFATEELADELDHVDGGAQRFPDAWERSDHAPVVARFGSRH